MIPEPATKLESHPAAKSLDANVATFPHFNGDHLTFPFIVAIRGKTNTEAYERLCDVLEDIDREMLSFDSDFATLKKNELDKSKTDMRFILISPNHSLARIEFSYQLYFRSDSDFQSQCKVTANFLDFLHRVVNTYSCRKDTTVKSGTRRVRLSTRS